MSSATKKSDQHDNDCECEASRFLKKYGEQLRRIVKKLESSSLESLELSIQRLDLSTHGSSESGEWDTEQKKQRKRKSRKREDGTSVQDESFSEEEEDESDKEKTMQRKSAIRKGSDEDKRDVKSMKDRESIRFRDDVKKADDSLAEIKSNVREEADEDKRSQKSSTKGSRLESDDRGETSMKSPTETTDRGSQKSSVGRSEGKSFADARSQTGDTVESAVMAGLKVKDAGTSAGGIFSDFKSVGFDETTIPSDKIRVNKSRDKNGGDLTISEGITSGKSVLIGKSFPGKISLFDRTSIDNESISEFERSTTYDQSEVVEGGTLDRKSQVSRKSERGTSDRSSFQNEVSRSSTFREDRPVSVGVCMRPCEGADEGKDSKVRIRGMVDELVDNILDKKYEDQFKTCSYINLIDSNICICRGLDVCNISTDDYEEYEYEEEEEEELPEENESINAYRTQQELYLQKHKIEDVCHFMISALLTETPNNPIKFLINLLDKLIMYRQGTFGPPVLYKKKHVESIFNMMDPLGFGHITFMQYKTAMFTLNLKGYNNDPELNSDGLVSKTTFLHEAFYAMVKHLDEIIRIHHPPTPVFPFSHASSSCTCDMSFSTTLN